MKRKSQNVSTDESARRVYTLERTLHGLSQLVLSEFKANTLRRCENLCYEGFTMHQRIHLVRRGLEKTSLIREIFQAANRNDLLLNS